MQSNLRLRRVFFCFAALLATACSQSNLTSNIPGPPITATSAHASSQSIYVNNCIKQNCGLYQYPVGVLNHAKPTNVLPTLPGIWVAFDKSGRRYAAEFGGTYIQVYSPDPSISAPVATLSVLSGQGASGIALDKNGNIWLSGNNQITEYPPLPASATGIIPLTAIRTIAGNKTRLLTVSGIAFDPHSGNLYVGNGYSVLAFDPSASGNVAPLINITGKKTLLVGDYNIAVDRTGRVLVARGSIYIFAPSATGNVPPTAIIDYTKPDTGDGGTDVATDAQNNVYVLDQQVPRGVERTTLVEFSPTASEGSKPIQTLTGPPSMKLADRPLAVH